MSKGLSIDIEPATKEALERAVALLGGASVMVQKASANAINRAITASRQEAVRHTRENYTMRAGTVRDSLKIKRANSRNTFAHLTSTGAALPLTEFKHSPTSNTSRAAVRASVAKSGQKNIKAAFTAKASPSRGAGAATGYQIFQRVGKARGPIRMLFGPSVPQMIGNANIIEKMESRTIDVFVQRLDHEITRELNRRAGK